MKYAYVRAVIRQQYDARDFILSLFDDLYRNPYSLFDSEEERPLFTFSDHYCDHHVIYRQKLSYGIYDFKDISYVESRADIGGNYFTFYGNPDNPQSTRLTVNMIAMMFAFFLQNRYPHGIMGVSVTPYLAG